MLHTLSTIATAVIIFCAWLACALYVNSLPGGAGISSLKVIEGVGFVAGGGCTITVLLLYFLYKTSVGVVDHNG